MFAWFHPRQSAQFNYSFDAADVQYSDLINRHFAALVHDGAPLPGWQPVTQRTKPVHDGLPPSDDWVAAEMRLPDAPAIRGDRVAACQLWLEAGWYERIGLIN